MTSTTLTQLEHHDEFIGRHIGPSHDEQQAMLKELGVDTLEALTKDTVPGSILRDPFFKSRRA